MLRSQTMADTARTASFQSCYDEARRLILEDKDVDGAICCLCAAPRPQSQPDCWRWTDLLAAALFAQGQYWHCLGVLCAYDRRYPEDRHARFAIRIVIMELLSALRDGEEARGSRRTP